MNSQEAADEIIKHIQLWSKENPRLLIGIDGIPGVGKSTILELIKEKLNALCVNEDDFLSPRDDIQKLIDQGVSSSELLDGLFDFLDINKLINAYKENKLEKLTLLTRKDGVKKLEKTYDLTKPIFIMEGTYMFHPDYFGEVWDKRIYLDGDEEEIKKRRVERVKKMVGDNYIPEDDSRSFFYHGFKALKLYQEKYLPKKQSDLVLSITSN